MSLVPLSTYSSEIASASASSGVSVPLLDALLTNESGNGAGLTDPSKALVNPLAISPAGAEGIAQFMPATAQAAGIDPFNPQQAIPGAADYLAALYKQFGDWNTAITAYNAGPGATAAALKKGVPLASITDKGYASNVEAAAAVFGGPVTTGAATAPGSSTGSGSGSTGTSTTDAGFLGLGKPLQAVADAINGVPTGIQTDVQKAGDTIIQQVQISIVESFVALFALALVAGGVMWLADSSGNIDVKSLVAAGVKSAAVA